MTSGEHKQDSIDPVDEAGLESFPASDPPGWVAVRPGIPTNSSLEMSAAECEIWNRALETAARLVEVAEGVRQKLSADIRSRKRPMDI